MITLNLTKPFNIFIPNPYRYMNREYLELFFDTGVLRVSSFARFRDYPDEIRGDQQEGNGVYMGHDPDKRVQFIVQTDDFNNSYMLSTSLFHDADLLRQFECNACFQIIDPLAFAVAVANALPGFIGSFQGYCNYQERRIISTEFEKPEDLMMRNSKGDFVIGDQNYNDKVGKIAKTGFEKLFVKEVKYQTQAEYRFVWLVDSANFPVENYLDLNCKEAVNYCKVIQK